MNLFYLLLVLVKMMTVSIPIQPNNVSDMTAIMKTIYSREKPKPM